MSRVPIVVRGRWPVEWSVTADGHLTPSPVQQVDPAAELREQVVALEKRVNELAHPVVAGPVSSGWAEAVPLLSPPVTAEAFTRSGGLYGVRRLNDKQVCYATAKQHGITTRAYGDTMDEAVQRAAANLDYACRVNGLPSPFVTGAAEYDGAITGTTGATTVTMLEDTTMTKLMTKETEIEATPTPRKARVKKQAKEAASAVGLGLQLAAANEAGEVLLDMAKELGKDVPAIQLALAHPDGREVAKLLMALMVQTMAEQTSIVPQADAVATACRLQMTASSFTLIGPRLNKLRKHFTKLGRVGSAAAVTAGAASAGALHARVADDEENEELREKLEELQLEVAALREKGAKAAKASR